MERLKYIHESFLIFKKAMIPYRAFVFCRNMLALLWVSIKACSLIGLADYFVSEFNKRKRQRALLLTFEKILRHGDLCYLPGEDFFGLCMLIAGKNRRYNPRAK